MELETNKTKIRTQVGNVTRSAWLKQLKQIKSHTSQYRTNVIKVASAFNMETLRFWFNEVTSGKNKNHKRWESNRILEGCKRYYSKP